PEQDGWFEMTEIQKAYLLGRLDNYEIGNIANHIYNEFYFESLDIHRLENAIANLINHFPVMRTVYSYQMLQQKFLSLDEIDEYKININDFS
ncbi:hypothetical protein ABTF01_19825, partial [Acinetobacter baumannii]